MAKFKPRIKSGDRFTDWTVLARVPGSQWVCVCRCGAKSIVRTCNLNNGRSKRCNTCGSSKPKMLRTSLKLSRQVFKKLSSAARGAIRRCTNPKYPQWCDYGGRGISVYQAWVDNYGEFIKYLAMLPGHDNFSLELDRINNDGNYEPGNLRFVTRSVSMINRRSSRRN